MASRAAESVEHCNNHHRDPYDEQGILRRILTGLLAPESFEST
jgi:hypothetical protein